MPVGVGGISVLPAVVSFPFGPWYYVTVSVDDQLSVFTNIAVIYSLLVLYKQTQ